MDRATLIPLPFQYKEKDYQVSTLLLKPDSATSILVLGHGAGAGMHHRFMETLAEELGLVGIASLRYQFPYMEAGRRSPDRPPLCHATIEAVVQLANEEAPELPVFAGGKSFGGRMTSQASALDFIPSVKGLIFYGFPLHPPGKPSLDRADHLYEVKVPMLFLQGTRDKLAESELLDQVTGKVGKLASTKYYDQADHSFKVPKAVGKSERGMISALAHETANWMSEVT